MKLVGVEITNIERSNTNCLQTSTQSLHDKVVFKASRQKEFNELVDRGVFRLVPYADAIGFRIYGYRVFDEDNHAETSSALPKSIFAVTKFNSKILRLMSGALKV